jgi:hypothetical protein
MQLDLFNGGTSPASDGHAENSTHPQHNPAPPYRKNSPPGTSDRAALMIAQFTPTLRDRILATIRDRGPVGLTDDEGEAILSIIAQTYTPRRGELVRAGKVRDSGERRPTSSGRPAAVWVSVEGVNDGKP